MISKPKIVSMMSSKVIRPTVVPNSSVTSMIWWRSAMKRWNNTSTGDVFLRHRERARHFRQRAGEVRVLQVREQHVAADDEADHLVERPIVNRDAGERLVFHHFDEIHQQRGLRQRENHRPRRHDVPRFHRVQLDQILHELALALAERTGFLAHPRHRQHFLTMDGGIHGALGREEPGDLLRPPHQWLESDDHHMQQRCRPASRMRKPRADRLGDDFRENQNRQREHGRENRLADVSVKPGILRTRTGRAHGMGNGVERQDRGKRTVDIRLERLHPAPLRSDLLRIGDGRRGQGEQRGLKDGTNERDAEREEDVADK